MKRKAYFLLAASLCLLPLTEGVGTVSLSGELPESYKKWLEEEVSYIITPKEKEIFVQLVSDKERDIFIEAFWKQRDPTPGTPQNEFKEEHYRRIAHANAIYGRGTPRPGWMTDQGRIYIILGEPIDVEKYEGQSVVYPSQIWTYKGDQRYGLPPYFRLVFFQEKGMGEYKLYSPVSDGIRELMIDKNIAGGDLEIAYTELFKYDAELAQASLSLIPDEFPTPTNPSLASEILLGNVASLPRKMVKEEYAEKLLKYKDIVEVEYTANYISSDSAVSLIQDNQGTYFIHFSVEPETLSVDYYNGKYVSHFELNGKVSDFLGRTIFQYGKTFPLELTEDQLEQLKASSYAIQDAFPVIPGSYSLSVLVKNSVSKEFTSFERDIYVPEAKSLVQMSSLLLGYRVEKNTASMTMKKPFAVSDFQVLPNSKALYATNDRLAVFFQLHGLPSPLIQAGHLEFLVKNEEKNILTETRTLSELNDTTNILAEFPLDRFSPGFYKVRVSLIDGEKKEILFDEKEFQVIAAGVARPWIISKSMPLNPNTQAEVEFILANQHYAGGSIPEAIGLMEKVYNRMPQLRYAHRLAEILLANKEYARVKGILTSYRSASVNQFEWLSLLGKACQALGEYEEAIQSYREYLVRIGANIEILNSTGDCYLAIGNTEQAITTWERSLELNPNQPALQKKIDALKKQEQRRPPTFKCSRTHSSPSSMRMFSYLEERWRASFPGYIG